MRVKPYFYLYLGGSNYLLKNTIGDPSKEAEPPRLFISQEEALKELKIIGGEVVYPNYKIKQVYLFLESGD